MAHHKDKTDRFVILSVKEGFGFSYLKNKPVRITATLDNKSLLSQYIVGGGEPVFNCNFLWCATNTILKRLLSSKANIFIQLQTSSDDKQKHNIGYATIGLGRAQSIISDDLPSYQTLDVRGTKPTFGVRTPQLFVLLSVQNVVRVKANEECYSAKLEDVKDDDKYIPSSKHQSYDTKHQIRIRKLAVKHALVQNKSYATKSTQTTLSYLLSKKKRLIIEGARSSNIHNLITESTDGAVNKPTRCSSSCVPLVVQKLEMGKVYVDIKYADLGLKCEYTKTGSLDSVHKEIETSNMVKPLQNIASDMEKLIKIHTKLNDTRVNMFICFDKIAKQYALDVSRDTHRAADVQATTLYKKPTSAQLKATTKRQSEELIRKSKQEQEKDDKLSGHGCIVRCDLCNCLLEHQKSHCDKSNKIDPNNDNEYLRRSFVDTLDRAAKHSEMPITVSKHTCDGYKWYREVGLARNISRGDKLIFWCKDCCIKQLQTDLMDTMQNSALEINDFKLHMKELQEEHRRAIKTLEEHTKETDISADKERLEYLAKAQHNLTMLLIHANNQNHSLEISCGKLSEELKQLIETAPGYTDTDNNNIYRHNKKDKEIYTRVRELKQELLEYRDDNGLSKKVSEPEKLHLTSYTAIPKIPSSTSTPNSLSLRKQRCEACRILKNHKKVSVVKDVKPKN